MTPATQKVEVAGISVTVNEITVNQIRGWLASVESTETDVVDKLLIEHITLSDIVLCTDLTDKQISKLKPSELQTVADKCTEVNQHFFFLRERIQLVVAPGASVQPLP